MIHKQEKIPSSTSLQFASCMVYFFDGLVGCWYGNFVSENHEFCCFEEQCISSQNRTHWSVWLQILLVDHQCFNYHHDTESSEVALVVLRPTKFVICFNFRPTLQPISVHVLLIC
ncbi:hypothetical protein F2P56_027409, partial [Juglans regia]